MVNSKHICVPNMVLDSQLVGIGGLRCCLCVDAQLGLFLGDLFGKHLVCPLDRLLDTSNNNRRIYARRYNVDIEWQDVLLGWRNMMNSHNLVIDWTTSILLMCLASNIV